LSQPRLLENTPASSIGHLGERPFFDPGIGKCAHIREEVLEKFQGRGIGRTMIIYALEKLKALGTQDIFLATAETNDAAKHLYPSLGSCRSGSRYITLLESMINERMVRNRRSSDTLP